MHTKNVVSTVLGIPCYEGSSGHLNRKIKQTKLWHVLLCSGSDGDVLFVKKGLKEIPYIKQLVPQIWQSSRGHFQTDKIGEGIKVKFVEYSENKRTSISPYIMEYDEDNYDPNLTL